MSYLLSQEHARYLAAINFESDHVRSMFYFDYQNGWGKNEEKYIEYQKNHWERKIFNKLIKKQPELTNLISEFWDKAKKEKYIDVVFGKIFADKIDIMTLSDLVFNCVIRPYNDERKDFIKDIIKNEPSLMNDLHHKLAGLNDNILLAAYIDLLPKFHKEINVEQKDIFNIIKQTKNYPETNAIKVLNCLVKTFEPNQDLYDFIQKHFKVKIETFHKLRDKITTYEKTTFANCVKEKKEKLCISSQEYKYFFKIKQDILIDNYKFDKNNIYDFYDKLHESIGNTLTKEIKIEFITHSDVMEITTENITDYPKIVQIMQQIEKALPEFMDSIPQDCRNGKVENLNELLSSFMLKIDLEKNLPTNTEPKKNKMKV